MIQTIKKSILWGITFLFTVIIWFQVYAAWLNLNTRSAGYTVSNTDWNDVINGLNLLWPKVDALEAAWWWVGYSQTRQDFTASRWNDVVYTNSTGKPIIVSVSTLNSNTVSAQWGYVDSILISLVGSMASRRSAVLMVVPNGSTYHVWRNGSNTLVNWSELR